jgi:hypothetical protein
MQVIEKRFEMSEKSKIKETRKSREKLRDLDMPNDPRELARAMFQAADQKVREKQLKKSRRII